MILQINTGTYVVWDDSKAVSHPKWSLVRNQEVSVFFREICQSQLGVVLDISEILSLT
jgi:hypothetical protein